LRILLLEDSRRFREVLTEALETIGFAVDSCGLLREARQHIAQSRYSLALVDLGLPDGNGLDLVQEIRAMGRGEPVMIVTASPSARSEYVAYAAGANDYLVKPFDGAVFAARCARLMGRGPPEGAAAATSVDDLLTGGSPLTASERVVLGVLAARFGRVGTIRHLQAALATVGLDATAGALDLAVWLLAQRLQAARNAASIETIRGVGFMLRLRNGARAGHGAKTPKEVSLVWQKADS